MIGFWPNKCYLRIMFNKNLPGLIISLGILTLSCISSYSIYNCQQANQRQLLESTTRNIADQLSYNLQAGLNSIESLGLIFKSSTPDYQEFREAAVQATCQQPAIRAITWAPLISDPQTFNNIILHAGLPPIPTPPTQSSHYFPVVYNEPLDVARIGQDLSLNQSYLGIIRKARDSSAVSAEIQQSDSARQIIRTVLPIFSQESKSALKPELYIKGYLSADIDISQIYQEALRNRSDINIRIREKSDFFTTTDLLPKGTFYYELPRIADLNLILTAASSQTNLPFIAIYILLGGTILASLSFSLSRYLISNSSQTEEALTIRSRALTEASRKLEQVASYDELSNSANRKLFDTILHKEWQRAMRNQNPICMILIDIDYLKDYNECYGYAAGERCIRSISHCLSSMASRSSDLVARYSSKQFALLLPGLSDLDFAERCRSAVADLNIEHAYSQSDSCVTVSVGFHQVVPQRDSDPQELTNAVEEALYQAKSQGRNCVRAYGQAAAEEAG